MFRQPPIENEAAPLKKKKSDVVDAIRYTFKVVDSHPDPAFNAPHLTEIYIPSAKLAFNSLAVFNCDGPRCRNSDAMIWVPLTSEFVDQLIALANLRAKDVMKMKEIRQHPCYDQLFGGQKPVFRL